MKTTIKKSKYGGINVTYDAGEALQDVRKSGKFQVYISTDCEDENKLYEAFAAWNNADNPDPVNISFVFDVTDTLKCMMDFYERGNTGSFREQDRRLFVRLRDKLQAMIDKIDGLQFVDE